jgi:hypothetical protein
MYNDDENNRVFFGATYREVGLRRRCACILQEENLPPFMLYLA